MQVTIKKKSAQPWWVIILIIPMLVSCAVPVVIWQVALYVGAGLMYTAAGQVIEKVVDNLVEQLFHSDSPGYVIIDPTNPLQGNYSKEMKFATTDRGETKKYELPRPRMVRDSKYSVDWQLAPDLKALVNQVLKGGS